MKPPQLKLTRGSDKRSSDDMVWQIVGTKLTIHRWVTRSSGAVAKSWRKTRWVAFDASGERAVPVKLPEGIRQHESAIAAWLVGDRQ